MLTSCRRSPNVEIFEGGILGRPGNRIGAMQGALRLPLVGKPPIVSRETSQAGKRISGAMQGTLCLQLAGAGSTAKYDLGFFSSGCLVSG